MGKKDYRAVLNVSNKVTGIDIMANGSCREVTRFAISLEISAKSFPCNIAFVLALKATRTMFMSKKKKISNIRSPVRITVTGSFVVLRRLYK